MKHTCQTLDSNHCFSCFHFSKLSFQLCWSDVEPKGSLPSVSLQAGGEQLPVGWTKHILQPDGQKEETGAVATASGGGQGLAESIEVTLAGSEGTLREQAHSQQGDAISLVKDKLSSGDQKALFDLYRKEAALQIAALEAKLEEVRENSRRKQKKLRKLLRKSQAILGECAVPVQPDLQPPAILISTVPESSAIRHPAPEAVDYWPSSDVPAVPICSSGPGVVREEAAQVSQGAGHRSLYSQVIAFTDTLSSILLQGGNLLVDASEKSEMNRGTTDLLTQQQLEAALSHLQTQLERTTTALHTLLSTTHSPAQPSSWDSEETEMEVKGQDISDSVTECKSSEQTDDTLGPTETEMKPSREQNSMKHQRQSQRDEPSACGMVMFTHMDWQFNKRALTQALHRSRLPVGIYEVSG
ncbi:uncharacterized protein LOC136748798 [Amia ocellicauda]|uniref:uncharacterized protein LOC136748798 n=1 Tax=Amia ocellicauda TaxID=2972642 RepID=UPI00346404C6